jgi:glycosyltransferase involved in cell wall biosynthesis
LSQTLSLIIPVYNEAEHLERFLGLIDELRLSVTKELVIVNDGSTDESGEILRRFRFNSATVLIDLPRNLGKGAAVREGVRRATGDFIGIQDADFETDLTDVPKLLEPLLEGRADVVYGSRFKKTSYHVHRTFHYLSNRLLTIFSNLLSGLYLSDMETCYKFFRADVIKNIRLESNRFGFEPEVTAKIARLHLRIMELPVSYFPRKYLEGKKLDWKDGVAAFRHIIYFNLVASRKQSDCFYETLPKRYFPRAEGWL